LPTLAAFVVVVVAVVALVLVLPYITPSLYFVSPYIL
jgi:hypothetical protein